MVNAAVLSVNSGPTLGRTLGALLASFLSKNSGPVLNVVKDRFELSFLSHDDDVVGADRTSSMTVVAEHRFQLASMLAP